jgi:hypothetical protein
VVGIRIRQRVRREAEREIPRDILGSIEDGEAEQESGPGARFTSKWDLL